jgi:hypothetical protein
METKMTHSSRQLRSIILKLRRQSVTRARLFQWIVSRRRPRMLSGGHRVCSRRFSPGCGLGGRTQGIGVPAPQSVAEAELNAAAPWCETQLVVSDEELTVIDTGIVSESPDIHVAENKCVQHAVITLARAADRAVFLRLFCATSLNDTATGTGCGPIGLRNLYVVAYVLRYHRCFVTVYGALAANRFRQGALLGRLSLGDTSGYELGALAWFTLENHVAPLSCESSRVVHSLRASRCWHAEEERDERFAVTTSR